MSVTIIAFIGLVFSGFTYLLGYKQGKIAQKTLDLSIRKATPRICSRVSISEPEIVRGVSLRYTMRTTLYNDGDLVASKVEGTWKLVTSHSIEKAEKTIRIDSLPSCLSWDFNHELSGKTRLIQTDPTVGIEVHIDIVYLGMNNQKEAYNAKYRYDPKQKAMTQCSDNNYPLHPLRNYLPLPAVPLFPLQPPSLELSSLLRLMLLSVARASVTCDKRRHASSCQKTIRRLWER
jgi:hypothetical protein